MLTNEIRNATQILFRNKQCTKCGTIGDQRCMPLKCHGIQQIYHPSVINNEDRIHTLNLIPAIHRLGIARRHFGNLIARHSQPYAPFHPGQFINYHSGSWTSRHTGNWVKCHPGHLVG